MPKIINGLRESIIAETKRQMLTKGYSNVTVRSVVEGCGISVGTLYNYFSSKEELTAAFLLEDWAKCTGEMREFCQNEPRAHEALRSVYQSIASYSTRYGSIFGDEGAKKNASGQFYSRHKLLRGQIAEIIEPTCRANAKSYSPFLAEFIAESLISWSVEGREFAELWDVVSVLFG